MEHEVVSYHSIYRYNPPRKWKFDHANKILMNKILQWIKILMIIVTFRKEISYSSLYNWSDNRNFHAKKRKKCVIVWSICDIPVNFHQLENEFIQFQWNKSVASRRCLIYWKIIRLNRYIFLEMRCFMFKKGQSRPHWAIIEVTRS